MSTGEHSTLKRHNILGPRQSRPEDEQSADAMEMRPIRPGLPVRRESIQIRRTNPMRRRTFGLAAVGIAALLGFLFALQSYWALRGNQQGGSLEFMPGHDIEPQEEKGQSSGILLHPEDHVYRAPAAIELNWRVSAGYRSPDGVKKRVYLVNGLFPGPTVEVRSGDEVIIEVQNDLADEGLAFHWHGLLVPNEMDGAVGFTQCPIAPGENFTYRFRIPDDCAGTFWWHAHFRSQRGDGLFGGFVVHTPASVGEQVDSERYGYEQDVLLMIGDWFHRSAEEVLEWYTSLRGFGNEPVPDSLLVNGRGRFNCSMAVPARPVECSWLGGNDLPPLIHGRPIASRLRLINVGAIAGFSVQISGATLQLITVDGGFTVTSSPADKLGILYPGERADVVARWDEGIIQSQLLIGLDREDFNYPNPSLNPDQSFSMLGPVPESGLTSGSVRDPASTLDITTVTAGPNSTHTVPVEAQHTILVYIKTQKLSHKANIPMGYLNHTHWIPQEGQPLLGRPREEWDQHQLVPHIPMSGTSNSKTDWVDLILNNLDDGSHPFHLHGRPFYILSRYRAGRGGWGSWNPYEGPPPGGLFEAPLLKDTVSVPRRGHVLLRFPADSEGIWMLHCHMLVHLGGGMAMGLHVGRDEAHVAGMNKDANMLCK